MEKERGLEKPAIPNNTRPQNNQPRGSAHISGQQRSACSALTSHATRALDSADQNTRWRPASYFEVYLGKHTRTTQNNVPSGSCPRGGNQPLLRQSTRRCFVEALATTFRYACPRVRNKQSQSRHYQGGADTSRPPRDHAIRQTH